MRARRREAQGVRARCLDHVAAARQPSSGTSALCAFLNALDGFPLIIPPPNCCIAHFGAVFVRLLADWPRQAVPTFVVVSLVLAGHRAVASLGDGLVYPLTYANDSLRTSLQNIPPDRIWQLIPNVWHEYTTRSSLTPTAPARPRQRPPDEDLRLSTRHAPHRTRPLCTERHKIKPGMRYCKYPRTGRLTVPRTLRRSLFYLCPASDRKETTILRRSR